MGTLVNSLWDRFALSTLRLGYEHGAKAPLGSLRLGLLRLGYEVSAYCLLSSKFSQPLNPINYSAYRTFFVFVPAGFTVVASKINDLQMTLFPFAFGKSFF